MPKGMPVTSSLLEQWGISRQLAHRYVQSGWLEPLGYGYFLRPGETPTQTGAVAALEMQGMALHIGGKAALSGAAITVGLGNFGNPPTAPGNVSGGTFTANGTVTVNVDPTDTEALLAEAAEVVKTEINPVSGLEGSADYKRELAGTLLKRVGKEALQRAQKA